MRVFDARCPLCGMGIPRKMYSWFGRVARWMVEREIGGAARSVTIKEYSGEDLADKGAVWYNRIKQAVGILACNLGIVSEKLVVREVIPAYIKDQLQTFYEKCKSLTKYIRVQEKELGRLTVKIVKMEKHKYSWGNVFLPKVKITVKDINRRNVKW